MQKNSKKVTRKGNITDTDGLQRAILAKKSFLCVGLDTDIERIPAHLLHEQDPLFAFNKQIIDATLPYTVAFKPNLAFYEAQGSGGWRSLERTMAYIPEDVLVIADAKRGDIGNTANQYAKAMFEHLCADAVTVSPYMGMDAIEPFLDYQDKWTIVLSATSNKSASDFITKKSGNLPLYLKVVDRVLAHPNNRQAMFVMGATRSDLITKVRQHAPDHFLLVPGIGAQGGDLESVVRCGLNRSTGLIVNASRSILYAANDKRFAAAAAREAQKLQKQMMAFLDS